MPARLARYGPNTNKPWYQKPNRETASDYIDGDTWDIINGFRETLTNGWKIYEQNDRFILKNASGKPIYSSEVMYNPGPRLRRAQDAAANERYRQQCCEEGHELSGCFPNDSTKLTILQEYEDTTIALIFSRDGRLLFDVNVYRDAFELNSVCAVQPLKNTNGIYAADYFDAKFNNLQGLLDSNFQPIVIGLTGLWIKTAPSNAFPGKTRYNFGAYYAKDIYFDFEVFETPTESDVKKVFADFTPVLQKEYLSMMKQYNKEHCR